MGNKRLFKLLVVSAICIVVVVLNISMFNIIPAFTGSGSKHIMGGTIYADEDDEVFASAAKQYIKPDDNYVERFLRPSGQEPMEKGFSAESGRDEYPKSFKMPADAVKAYFDILSDASNLGEKKGGCGNIGMDKAPYPAAYEMLSDRLKSTMDPDEFIESFEGIGHINLMKLIDVPAVKLGDTVYPRVFVEIETIEGSDTQGKTFFAYYYGFVAAEENKDSGWKISSIQLKPQDFLCHAYHGWWHDAGTIVDVLYGKKYGVIDKILGVEENGSIRNVLAKGKDGKQYRFMFARITNGADIELRQYVLEDGIWKDAHIGINK